MNRRELVRLARERVYGDYSIVGRGNIGEPSNGALILRMAAALDPRPTPAEVIDWIETELYNEENFRDIPEILTDARTRFTTPPA